MNKITERIASLILALAMILGNTSHTQAAGSATNPGTSSAPLKTFAKANSILTVNTGNTRNINTGAYNQQLNITKSGIGSKVITLPAIQRTNAVRQLPSLQSTGSGMWISTSELMSLPTSGTAWDKMRTAAYGSWGTADLKNQNNKHDVNLLAGAFVYARTGDAALRGKVRDGILAAKRTLDESSEWQTHSGVLAAGRQLGAYVISADLINLKNYDASADNEFRSWLTTIRTTNIGTHGRWKAITFTCENAAGNWNTFACASRIGASIYLGDTADVDRAASIIRAFFGERRAYPAGAPGKNGYFQHTAGYDSSWVCDDPNWTGINPSCVKSGVNIDGVLVEDAARGGGCCTVQGSGIGYSWEALQGLFVSAELLYRTGRYGDPYSWSNQALKRAMDFMQRSGWGISNVARYVPWMANARYNTNYPTTVSVSGRIMSWGDWLYRDTTTALVSQPTVNSTPTTINPTNTPMLFTPAAVQATATLTSMPISTTQSVTSPTPLMPTATPTTGVPSTTPIQPTSTSIQPTATSIVLPTQTLALPTATFLQPTVAIVQPTTTSIPTGVPSSETIYDDKNSGFVYSPGWQNKANTKAYKGSFKLTTQNDASVTFTFTGQAFSILYKGGKAFSKLDVFVDGQLVGTLDQNLSTTTYQKRWDYPGQLGFGKHTLKLVFKATSATIDRSSLDAVIVR